MRIQAGLPTGVTGVLFDEARSRRRLEASMAALLEGEGFSEVILPILDYFEPYEPLLTPGSRDELYRFVDQEGELLALRGDFTPLLARLIAPRLATLELPLRLFYRGDVVRQQEVRPGRLREYYALGAETLGGERQRVDEEILRLFARLLCSRDVGGIRIVLGFAGALDRLLQAAAGDGAGELAAAVGRRERGPARHSGEALLQVVERGVPEDPAALGPEAAAYLSRLLDLRRRLESEFSSEDVEFTVDLAEFATNTLAEELHITDSKWTYYDGVVFRAHQSRSGLEVGRGGRYDRLFRALGAEVPAVGFSLGVDGLLHDGFREGAR